MKKGLWVAIISALILSAGFVAAAEKKTGMAKMAGHMVYAPGDIKWTDAPPILPAGAKAAVLAGDPIKGGSFAMPAPARRPVGEMVGEFLRETGILLFVSGEPRARPFAAAVCFTLGLSLWCSVVVVERRRSK